MGYARDAGFAVRRLSDELETLVRQVASDSRADITTFVRTLLAYLLRADGSLGSEERIILSVYNGDNLSFEEEDDYARQTVASSPRFLRTVPTFILLAKEYDDLYGASVAPAMITCIAAICSTVAAIDGTLHPEESENTAVLLSTLRSAIDADGESWHRG